VPALLGTHGLTDLQICEFQLPSRDPAFLADLRREIEANGVTLDALLIDHGDVTHPDRHEADAQAIAGWLDVAHALGARHARIAAGDQAPTDATLERSAAHLCRLRDLGRERGVRVVTENWKRLLPSSREVLTPDALRAAASGLVGVAVVIVDATTAVTAMTGTAIEPISFGWVIFRSVRSVWSGTSRIRKAVGTLREAAGRITSIRNLRAIRGLFPRPGDHQ
jgi:hypothetical protein